MKAVGGPVVRRIAQVATDPTRHHSLLAGVGLSPTADPRDWIHEAVAEEAYYDMLEQAADPDDFELPLRYGNAVQIDDFGALGLGVKTASTVRDALGRLRRYILVLSNTLEYDLHEVVGGADYLMNRTAGRRGARLANECAFAAVISLLRQIAAGPVTPVAVSFRHVPPPSTDAHQAYFGCPVRFEDRVNAIGFNAETLQTRGRLADEGLSAFILASLDDMKRAKAEPSLEMRVRWAVTDALPDGKPSKSQIARRLGMSERTLHRRLAEAGETFQEIAARAQREAAESLLSDASTSLAEVAFLTGFSDQSAFTRAFKTWTGQTPLNFRQSSSSA